MKKYIFCVFYLFIFLNCSAQIDTIPYAANTTKENRANEYRYLVNNSIIKNLSLPLTGSTEEYWEDAFYAMELINYRTPWIDNKIRPLFNSLEKRSIEFQRAFLALIYSLYPKDFVTQIATLMDKISDTKSLTMCGEYIFLNNKEVEYRSQLIKKRIDPLFDPNDRTLYSLTIVLHYKLYAGEQEEIPPLKEFFNDTILKNEIVLFSFQRKNRNYPGLAMVRKKDGEFIKDETGKYFSVPQLARSITNMPGYLTNGNTPQGIFKMTGFDISKGSTIGPTTNIQMVLPFEKSTEVADSITQSLGKNYAKLLPDSWQNYYPIYEAFYAGGAGRTEIIVHGTTVNPEYYKNQPYYPLTPTLGCLTSKEIWSTVDGKRIESDQQKLVNAVKAAGGADGYCIVIEIDDQQKPVSIAEILPYLTKKIK